MGVISTQFCFTYSLGGVIAVPRGLHSRLCHAFLVYIFSKEHGNRRWQISPPERNSQWVLPVFIVEQNSVGISAVVCLSYDLSSLRNKHDAKKPLYETRRHLQNRKYITYHDAKRRTQPRSWATCTNIWWSSDAWFLSYASGLTNRLVEFCVSVGNDREFWKNGW